MLCVYNFSSTKYKESITMFFQHKNKNVQKNIVLATSLFSFNYVHSAKIPFSFVLIKYTHNLSFFPHIHILLKVHSLKIFYPKVEILQYIQSLPQIYITSLTVVLLCVLCERLHDQIVQQLKNPYFEVNGALLSRSSIF